MRKSERVRIIKLMQASSRIALNTVAQYARSIINMLLSLYSSRLVLNYLGVEDYGIYSLVAGIVSMLSFLTNSLVGSTQRFLSVNQGKGDLHILKEVFSNSLLLHLILGLIISIILESCTFFIFDSVLVIPTNRIYVARILYQQVIWMLYISFIASPFRALLVSRENIVYTSVIDVIDGVLKVCCIACIPLFTADRLLVYGWIMFGVQCFSLVAFMFYCYLKYEECILPKLDYFTWGYLKELSSYTGWMIYSSAAIASRNQGLAIVINRFFGTALNAAYGIGNQISGMLSFVCTSFTNAISPQLMAAEGSGNRNKMLQLAEIQSKFSFLLLSMLAVPTLFEMKSLLSLWLGQVPDGTVLFASAFIIMQTVDQLSQGLGVANRAIGHIGKYTLITYTPKLLILPVGWLVLKYNYPIIFIVVIMIALEYLCMMLRIYLFKNVEGFNVFNYCRNVLIKTIMPVLFSSVVCFFIVIAITSVWRFVLTFFLSIPIFIISTYYQSLNDGERNMLKVLGKRIIEYPSNHTRKA